MIENAHALLCGLRMPNPLLGRCCVAVNSTTPNMELEVSLGPVSIGWWRMYANMQDSLELMKTNMGTSSRL